MSKSLSLKQKKKIEVLKKRKTRKRVSKYRDKKKIENSKLIQFYIDEKSKDILDEYKNIYNQTSSEVFKNLILSVLKRRLK